MKKTVFFITVIALFALLPFAAQAQSPTEEQANTPAYFTPNLPSDNRGLILFDRPAYSATQHSGNLAGNSWWIAPGERVRVNHLRDNGWAEVSVINPHGVEQSGYILMRMLVPVSGDVVAETMFAAFEHRVELELFVMKLAAILVGAGFLISFMGFLGRFRTVLQYLIILSASVPIVYFLLNMDGFTYISPAVYGWRWAAIWFGCFSLFLVAQVYLFINTLNSIEREMGSEIAGINLIVMISIVIFFALYLLAGILSELIWRPLIVPFAWVDQNFNWVFLGVQALIVIWLFVMTDSKSKVLLIIPLYIVGFAAIVLLFQGMILGLILATFAFLVLGGSGGKPGSRSSSSERVESDADKRYQWYMFRKREKEFQERRDKYDGL